MGGQTNNHIMAMVLLTVEKLSYTSLLEKTPSSQMIKNIAKIS